MCRLKFGDCFAVFVSLQNKLSMPCFGLPFKLLSPCRMSIDLTLEIIRPKVDFGTVTCHATIYLIDIITKRIDIDMTCWRIKINTHLLFQHFFSIFKFLIYCAKIDVCILFVHIDPCVIELIEVFLSLLIRSRSSSTRTPASGRIILFLSLILSVSLGQGLLWIAEGISVVGWILKIVFNSGANKPHRNTMGL